MKVNNIYVTKEPKFFEKLRKVPKDAEAIIDDVIHAKDVITITPEMDPDKYIEENDLWIEGQLYCRDIWLN